MQTYALDLNQVAFLLAQIPERRFNVEETLVYKGQVPMTGFVLLKGKMTLTKKGGEPKEVPLNTMICVRELLKDRPLSHNLVISPDSKVIVLDKSTILEMLESDKGLFLTA